MATKYVALLRGINVGGKNKLPMKELAILFQEAGCANVRTFIQSGNVLFELPNSYNTTQVGAILGSITAAISGQFGHRPPIVVRSEAEIKATLAHNPYIERGDPIDTLFVMFLADVPIPSKVSSLDSLRSAPDEFAVHGKDIYLYIPTSAATTKLTNAYFDTKLGTVSTSRNWRTVTKLVELLGD